jgi:hypothetical protein
MSAAVREATLQAFDYHLGYSGTTFMCHETSRTTPCEALLSLATI